MVALSLYRGNLHRVPDVTRRWLMPARAISFNDFKLLYHRRSKALSRLHPSTTTTSDPIPNPKSKDNEIVIAPPSEEEEDRGANRLREGTAKCTEPKQVKNREEIDCGESTVKAGDDSNLLPTEKLEVAEKNKEDLHSVDPQVKTTSKADMVDDKQKRKKEVEEKLEI